MDPGDSIEQIEEQALSVVMHYWMSVRRSDALPTPNAIDPLDLKEHLGLLSIVETAPRLEDFRIRLFGTRLVHEFQQERTGLRFGDIRAIENWDTVNTPYLFVRDTARPHYQAMRVVSGMRPFQGYARLLLPLASDGATVDRILAAFDFFPISSRGLDRRPTLSGLHPTPT